jgi:hypothetical protein
LAVTTDGRRPDADGVLLAQKKSTASHVGAAVCSAAVVKDERPSPSSVSTRPQRVVTDGNLMPSNAEASRALSLEYVARMPRAEADVASSDNER